MTAQRGSTTQVSPGRAGPQGAETSGIAYVIRVRLCRIDQGVRPMCGPHVETLGNTDIAPSGLDQARRDRVPVHMRRAGDKKAATRFPSRGLSATYQVEARGFEPRSENRSTTASTCVVHQLMFPSAGRWTTDCRMSPPEFARWRWARQTDYPRFAIPAKTPWEGFLAGTRRN